MNSRQKAQTTLKKSTSSEEDSRDSKQNSRRVELHERGSQVSFADKDWTLPQDDPKLVENWDKEVWQSEWS